MLGRAEGLERRGHCAAVSRSISEPRGLGDRWAHLELIRRSHDAPLPAAGCFGRSAERDPRILDTSKQALALRAWSPTSGLRERCWVRERCYRDCWYDEALCDGSFALWALRH
jgi:hypothetical protein